MFVIGSRTYVGLGERVNAWLSEGGTDGVNESAREWAGDSVCERVH